MAAAIEFVRQAHGIILSPTETDLFWACYSEDYDLVFALWKQHPGLVLYTLCSWDEENWIYRGFRNVNRLGHILGARDLGEGFHELLWKDQLE